MKRIGAQHLLVVTMMINLSGCDSPPKIGVEADSFGNVTITNLNNSPVEIKDITVNNRDDCSSRLTDANIMNKNLPIDALFFLNKNIDEKDKHELWLRDVQQQPDGKFAGRRCVRVNSGYSCAEDVQERYGLRDTQIILKTGETRSWSVTCQAKIAFVSVSTDHGSGTFEFK